VPAGPWKWTRVPPNASGGTGGEALVGADGRWAWSESGFGFIETANPAVKSLLAAAWQLTGVGDDYFAHIVRVNAELARGRFLLAQRVMDLTGEAHREVMASIGVELPPVRVQHVTEEEAADLGEDE